MYCEFHFLDWELWVQGKKCPFKARLPAFYPNLYSCVNWLYCNGYSTGGSIWGYEAIWSRPWRIAVWNRRIPGGTHSQTLSNIWLGEISISLTLECPTGPWRQESNFSLLTASSNSLLSGIKVFFDTIVFLWWGRPIIEEFSLISVYTRSSAMGRSWNQYIFFYVISSTNSYHFYTWLYFLCF